MCLFFYCFTYGGGSCLLYNVLLMVCCYIMDIISSLICQFSFIIIYLIYLSLVLFINVLFYKYLLLIH